MKKKKRKIDTITIILRSEKLGKVKLVVWKLPLHFRSGFGIIINGKTKEEEEKNHRRVSKLIRFLCRVSYSKLKFISSLSVIATLLYWYIFCLVFFFLFLTYFCTVDLSDYPRSNNVSYLIKQNVRFGNPNTFFFF